MSGESGKTVWIVEGTHFSHGRKQSLRVKFATFDERDLWNNAYDHLTRTAPEWAEFLELNETAIGITRKTAL